MQTFKQIKIDLYSSIKGFNMWGKTVGKIFQKQNDLKKKKRIYLFDFLLPFERMNPDKAVFCYVKEWGKLFFLYEENFVYSQL